MLCELSSTSSVSARPSIRPRRAPTGAGRELDRGLLGVAVISHPSHATRPVRVECAPTARPKGGHNQGADPYRVTHSEGRVASGSGERFGKQALLDALGQDANGEVCAQLEL